MAKHFDVEIGAPPKQTRWNITIGDTASKDFPVNADLTDWTATCFVVRNGNVEWIDASITGNVITIGVSAATTLTWALTDTIEFAVKVTKANGDKWTPFVGEIKLWDGLGWPT